MQSTPDQKFIDSFSAVLAGLILFTFVIIVLAIVISKRTAEVAQQEDGVYQAQLDNRIRPIGDVVLAGQDKTLYGFDPVASMAIAAGAPAAAPKLIMATFKNGQEVYDAACVACHGLGIAGAPKIGVAAQWAPRIAQGMELLYQHAIEGYQGSAGVMPAKGGRNDLTDEHVVQSVDYMIAQSK